METIDGSPDEQARKSRKIFNLNDLIKWSAGFFLFFGTASVVWWQNSRLTVLYDLCGVLEPATRIAQGDLPYRDFPFPYAPTNSNPSAW